jgi:tetratricopeptide (TPR) repeat protein
MEERHFASGLQHLRAGLTRELEPQGQAPDDFVLLRQKAATFTHLHYPTRRYPSTTWESVIETNYGGAAFDVGYALQTGGSKADVPLAESMYRDAVRLDPTLASAYKNLGLLLDQNGGDPHEIVSVWNRFLALDPSDPQASAIRARVATLSAKHAP